MSLLDALLAVLVLAIGLLGIAGLQSSALSNNFVAYQYTQAAMLTQSMLEKMRANPYAVGQGWYQLSTATPPGNPPVDCGASKCSRQEQAQWDLAVWYASIHGARYANAPTLAPRDADDSIGGALPNSAASIDCPGPSAANALCLVTVYWGSISVGPGEPYTCDDSTDEPAEHCFRLAYGR